ncbi:Rho termination factor N-terminal domain-containing protein, partial [Staphylococcus aureus]
MPEKERTSPQDESVHELYKNYTTKKLTQKAKTLKLTNNSKLNKKKLVLAIREAQMEK